MYSCSTCLDKEGAGRVIKCQLSEFSIPAHNWRLQWGVGGAGSPAPARVKPVLHNLWPSDASKMSGIHTNTKFKTQYKERCVLNPVCGLSLSQWHGPGNELDQKCQFWTMPEGIQGLWRSQGIAILDYLYSPKKRKTALMPGKSYAFFPPLVILTLIAIAGLSTQWLWFFNVTNNYSVDSMLGTAWTSSLLSGEIHWGSPCWLHCKRKKYHQWRLILPSAWRERARRPHVDLLSTLLPLLNSQQDKGKQGLSSSKGALPKMYYLVKGHTFRS